MRSRFFRCLKAADSHFICHLIPLWLGKNSDKMGCICCSAFFSVTGAGPRSQYDIFVLLRLREIPLSGPRSQYDIFVLLRLLRQRDSWPSCVLISNQSPCLSAVSPLEMYSVLATGGSKYSLKYREEDFKTLPIAKYRSFPVLFIFNLINFSINLGSWKKNYIFYYSPERNDKKSTLFKWGCIV